MSKDEIIAIWRAKNPSNNFIVETFDHSGANVENVVNVENVENAN